MTKGLAYERQSNLACVRPTVHVAQDVDDWRVRIHIAMYYSILRINNLDKRQFNLYFLDSLSADEERRNSINMCG
jgi:hypothetical protein